MSEGRAVRFANTCDATYHSLGIKMDPNLLKKEVKELSPSEMRRSWWKTQSKSRMAFLKMYIALQQCCIGVQAATVLSGTNKFELGLQGFDLFEILPELEDAFDEEIGKDDNEA